MSILVLRIKICIFLKRAFVEKTSCENFFVGKYHFHEISKCTKKYWYSWDFIIKAFQWDFSREFNIYRDIKILSLFELVTVWALSCEMERVRYGRVNLGALWTAWWPRSKAKNPNIQHRTAVSFINIQARLHDLLISFLTKYWLLSEKNTLVGFKLCSSKSCGSYFF